MKSAPLPVDVPLQEIIDLLESKPKETWTTGAYNIRGQFCALGHINQHYGGSAYNSHVESTLRTKAYRFIKEKYNVCADIVSVNDTQDVNNYTEEHPKDRVLHLLKDMKEAER